MICSDHTAADREIIGVDQYIRFARKTFFSLFPSEVHHTGQNSKLAF